MHWFRLTAALLVCPLQSGAAPGVEAPKPGRVAVIAVGRCDVASSAISARSFRALLQLKLGAALQTEAETSRPLGGLSERTLDEASRALAAARREFYAHKVDTAVTQLEALAVDVTRIAPSPERWKVEREVLTLLAQAQLPSKPSAAEAALVAILRVDPSYQPDTGLYPPTFRKFVDGIRTQQSEVPTNRLDVAVFPIGTVVYVGGCPVGPAPLSHRFPAGEYRVEADFGHRGLVRTVQVPAPPAVVAPVELAAGVEGALFADGGPCLESGAEHQAASLSRVAQLVGASRVFTIHTETLADRRWVVLEEDDPTGSQVRQARSEVQAGSPETDALAALAEWAATGHGGAAVEVLQRAVQPSVMASTPGAGGQVSGRVAGQPPVNGFKLQTFPFDGQLNPGPSVHFAADRFRRGDLPKGKTSLRVVTDDGRVGTAAVDVPASGNVETTIQVDKACSALGRVQNADGGPASGAHLSVQQVGTRITQSAETGPKGGFIFTELSKGEYLLNVQLGDQRLVRRFSLATTCPAVLGTLRLADRSPTRTPSRSSSTAEARDH